MIPKRIHYCWFGRAPMPDQVLRCLESWHEFMPDWEYILWNEDNFDVASYQYAKEAYDARKYAFVSDVARLHALDSYGGIYLDTDVLVFKSLAPLLIYSAFAGFEGSKHLPIGTCIMGSIKNGQWVQEQLDDYHGRHFTLSDGTYDTTTNVTFISRRMKENGFINNGLEQDYKDLHIFPVDYFCPRHTTGEYIRTDNTYCEHLGIGSWTDSHSNWKTCLLSAVSPSLRSSIIKLKRLLFG